MGFNEKVHAYIAARFYQYLLERHGERGEMAFIHGTQYYAEQRGRRMAQRAIRDGHPLTPANYYRYGEWVHTDEIRAMGCENRSQYQSYQPEAVLHITQCPWYMQFQEMGMHTTAGAEYCRHLDKSIVRGFNPYLTFAVEQTLLSGDCCIHRMQNADFDENSDLAKKPENIRSFAYHCAHSYWAYAEVTTAIFREDGKAISEKVLADFEDTYGKKMADTIRSYHNVNFNVCD